MIRLFLLALLPLMIFALLALSGCAEMCGAEGELCDRVYFHYTYHLKTL